MGLLINDQITLPNGIQASNIIVSIHSNFNLFKSVLNTYNLTYVESYYMTTECYITRVPIYTVNKNLVIPQEQLVNIISFIYSNIKTNYTNTQDC